MSNALRHWGLPGRAGVALGLAALVFFGACNPVATPPTTTLDNRNGSVLGTGTEKNSATSAKGVTAGSKGASASGADLSPADAALFLAGRGFIETSCLSCHSSGQATNWGVAYGASLEAWQTFAQTNTVRVDAAAAANSLIYGRVQAGDMPPGTPVPLSSQSLLLDWLTLIAKPPVVVASAFVPTSSITATPTTPTPSVPSPAPTTAVGSPVPGPTPNTSAAFAAGLSLIDAHCLSCHSSGAYNWGMAAGATEAAWRGWAAANPSRISGTNPASSSFLVRVSGGSMPPGSPLANADKTTFAAWIALFSSVATSTPLPSGTPAPTVSPTPTPTVPPSMGPSTPLPSTSPSPAASPSPAPAQPAAESAAFPAARDVFDSKCLGCHSSGSNNWGMQAGASETSWLNFAYQPSGRIYVGTNWASSGIIMRLRYNTSGDQSMPPNGVSFAASDYAAVSAWIETISPVAAPASPSPSPSPSFTPFLAVANNDRPHLSDRTLEASKMHAIFGAGLTAVDDLIASQTLQFGGPCLPRDQYSLYAASYCNHVKTDTVNYNADTIPLTSPVRMGLHRQVCDVALFNGGAAEVALKNAITVITGLSDLSYLTTTPVPTSAQLTAAFAAFNNYRQPDAATLAALTTVAGTAATVGLTVPSGETNLSLEPWRYVLWTICADPQHQMH